MLRPTARPLFAYRTRFGRRRFAPSNKSGAQYQDALRVAACAHRGQYRRSGEPFISHPIAVAELVARFGGSMDAIIASLLHDTIEDTNLDAAQIELGFGERVRRLVELVTNPCAGHISPAMALAINCTENAGVSGVSFLQRQALLIKTADRIHNMVTIDALTPWRRRRCADETLRVFVPLARLLGLSDAAEMLQSLARACNSNDDNAPDELVSINNRIGS